MASLKDLQLGKDVIPGDFDSLPRQRLMFRTPLQPGPYRFRLPELKALQEAHDKVSTRIGERSVERVKTVFRDGAELTVVQAPDKTRIGELFPTQITNVERNRARKNQHDAFASDYDYLLLALGIARKPTTNIGYLTEIEKMAGKDFGADVAFSFSCQKEDAKGEPRPIRIEVQATDEHGQPRVDEHNQPVITLMVLDGKDGREFRAGCGKRAYGNSKEVQEFKDAAGNLPTRMECDCGAILFAQENLENFRK